jgi:hypothetical protein
VCVLENKNKIEEGDERNGGGKERILIYLKFLFLFMAANQSKNFKY